jgi:hypothetical protein
MSADPASATGTLPRRARYLIPSGLPHRAETVAALGVLAVLAHLLLAPVTLVLAVCFHAVSRISRWQPHWLAAPAAAGLAWLTWTGPEAALAGTAAAPRAAAALAIRLISGPAGHGQAGSAAGHLLQSLPAQFPAALLAAAAEAAIAWWLRWLHTNSWDLPVPRPGLAVLGRRRVHAARLRAGGVVTREGVCAGVDCLTGRPAEVSWAEAGGGVLVTGASWAAVSAGGFVFVHAAIRRRRPVIAVDLAGDPAFTASVAAACAAADAPLQVFSAAGPGCYEPLQGGSPARKASLISSVIDWGSWPEAARQACVAVVTDVLAVAAAAPAGPGVPLLDDVIGLLDPAALHARLERVPVYHPRRAALAQRVSASAARLAAGPGAAALLAAELTALRAGPFGRWLGPAPSAAGRDPAAGGPDGSGAAPGLGGPAPGVSGGRAGGGRISLAGIARDRAVALFSLGQPGQHRSAGIIASLVALDAAAVFADLRREGLAGDGLAWFGGCEAASPAVLAGLLAAGDRSGLACVLGTTSPQAASWLAGQARVLAVYRLADAALAGQVALLTGTRLARAATDPAALAPGTVTPSWPAPAPGIGTPAGPVPGTLSAAAGPAGSPSWLAGGQSWPGAAAPGHVGTPALAGGAAGLPGPGGNWVAGGTGPQSGGGAWAAGGAGVAGSAAGWRAGGTAWPAAAAAPATGATPTAVPYGLVRRPVVPAETLCALPDGQFTLIVGPPGGRVIPRARAVRARIPCPRPIRPARLARLARMASAVSGAGPAAPGAPAPAGTRAPAGIHTRARIPGLASAPASAPARAGGTGLPGMSAAPGPAAAWGAAGWRAVLPRRAGHAGQPSAAGPGLLATRAPARMAGLARRGAAAGRDAWLRLAQGRAGQVTGRGWPW